MSVYVDELKGCLISPNWGHTRFCHLYADTEKELMEFACGIKCKPSWVQRANCGLLHFDLTYRMREIAIKAGAVEIGREKVNQLIKKARAK